MVGRTPAMQGLYALVARVMNTDLPVLITGESGTGKSLVAKAIHDLGDRRALPFVAAPATAFETMDGPAALIARARGGTIVFEEVGDLTSEAQARLVRMLDGLVEDGTVPRVLATSQVALEGPIREGLFREDLFYRLSAVAITVPPLRERVDDIPLLADHFLGRADRDGLGARHLVAGASERADARLHGWPGNVRQLEPTRRARLAGGHRRRPRDRARRGRGGAGRRGAARGAGRRGRRLRGGRRSGSRRRSPQHLRRHFDLHARRRCRRRGSTGAILREMEAPLHRYLARRRRRATRRAAPICSASIEIPLGKRSPTSELR